LISTRFDGDIQQNHYLARIPLHVVKYSYPDWGISNFIALLILKTAVRCLVPGSEYRCRQ
jgi:hypothetical protein